MTSISQRLWNHLDAVESRDRWIASGRSIIAIGMLSVLAFTPLRYLTPPVGDGPAGASCAGIRSASILCLGDPADFQELRVWFMMIVLAAVVVGLLPRVTGFLHAWVAFTMSASVTLPDGGDQIGLIMCLLLLPITTVDGRVWQWHRPTSPMSPAAQSVVAIAHLGIRVQLSFIYLDSAITKFGVDDWANGTAEFYIVRDPAFGASDFVGQLVRQITIEPLGTITITWGAIVVELAIGLALLLSWRWRRLAFYLDVALHMGIILTIGLWSFSLVMIGTAALAASTLRWSRPQTTADGFSDAAWAPSDHSRGTFVEVPTPASVDSQP